MTILFSNHKEKLFPIIPVRDGVIFPHTETTLTFGRPKSVAAIEAAYKSNRLLCFFSQKDSKIEDPGIRDIYKIGTIARIEELIHEEKIVYAVVSGIARVKLESFAAQEPFLIGEVSEIFEIVDDSEETKALYRNLMMNFQRALSFGKSVEPRIIVRLMGGAKAVELADQVSYVLDIDLDKKQELLETSEVKLRLKKAIDHLVKELRILEIERKITSKTQKKFDKSMKETVLRERKRAIEEELGEMSEEDEEAKDYEKKIKKARMSKKAYTKAKKELKRLSRLNPNHPEVGYIRTYIDWLVDLPWSKTSPNNTSIAQAEKILNEDHYGLSDVKERIVEYLAVMKLREKQEKAVKGREKRIEDIFGSTILCFVGPPGVGKTSIGRSIARSLGREFVRLSLGGIRDEAEIRGHRRTYVGSMPGRIIQAVKDAGTNNPVVMLDEIDKIGADFRGDPSSALLEALDPEQNKEFSDHYIEVAFDLSKVVFITTANMLETIPPALRDRMEVIRFAGYTEDEKFNIAKKYLWQKQLRLNGLISEKISVSDEALRKIIGAYTREAGVRELERNLAKVCRKIAKRVAENKKTKNQVSLVDIPKYLGPRRYLTTLAEKKDEIGMSTGLAYTQAGGDIILIEVALMPGKGGLIMTGKLGKVMQESGRAALSYIRSHFKELGLKEDFYKNKDIHVHVPEGAVPKDGPSAGVAIATAITSAFTKKPIRREVGMTGEVTLRGRILEIGGIKEKVIAAHRAGLKTLILPKDNKKDLEKIPAKIKKEISFKFVSSMSEVLEIALKN
ncbi:MAG: endopeptidase La [Patescibacteria group bacterium]